jgi:mitochondrial chaperone BCS1
MKNLLHTLVATFLHNPNQFASGGLLLMAIGSIGALLRKIPEKLWSNFVKQVTISLTVTDDSNLELYYLRRWLAKQSYMKRARHLDVVPGSTDAGKSTINPAPNQNQYLWYRGRLIQVYASRSDKKEGTAGAYSSSKRSESLILKTIGRNQHIFRALLDDVMNEAHFEPKPELHVWDEASWREITPYYPRPLESVILPASQKQEIVEDIERFRAQRDWYTEMGIPYRRGYLFEGPPGTGKSSLVVGLSSHFKSNVYFLKLSDMTDSSLREAICDLRANSFVIMEDIDAVHETHVRKTDEAESAPKLRGVSLSGLLNVLDGLLAPAGAMFFMTTNHVDKLDPALIRPGRVDLQLHIGRANEEQKQAMYERFFPGKICPAGYLNQDLTMAELQQALMLERVK